jgi:hypothetical protein
MAEDVVTVVTDMMAMLLWESSSYCRCSDALKHFSSFPPSPLQSLEPLLR